MPDENEPIDEGPIEEPASDETPEGGSPEAESEPTEETEAAVEPVTDDAPAGDDVAPDVEVEAAVATLEPATAVATLDAPDDDGTVSIESAQFPPIVGEAPGFEEDDRNLDLLLDVPVPITAEIGRADMPFADVLKLGPGSVIELDKSADEPVDVLVNGKFLATGEVVVVGERFGIRILDVVAKTG